MLLDQEQKQSIDVPVAQREILVVRQLCGEIGNRPTEIEDVGNMAILALKGAEIERSSTLFADRGGEKIGHWYLL